MDALLTILGLILLSAISSWLQRRSQKTTEDSWPEGGPPPAHRSSQRKTQEPGEERSLTSRMGDWEAELRRLLEGGEEKESEKPLPPIITKPAPASPPPSSRPPSRPLPAPVRAEVKPLTAQQVFEAEGGVMDESSNRFYGALSGFRDAQNLQGTIQNQMLAAAGLRKQNASSGRTMRLAREVPPIGRMLRSKQDARLGIIASVVLGPPKALESDSPLAS